MIRIGREACRQLETCLKREWLETDGLGGYASSTVLLCPTRRYHGLLVAPPPGSDRRHVFLSRFEETLHGNGGEVPLSMARYRSTWSPPGHRSFEAFELKPYPSATYRLGAAEVRREILLVRGRHVVLCRYSVVGSNEELELCLRPLLACRAADALTFENPALATRVRRLAGGIVCRPYAALPSVALTVSAGSVRFDVDPVWYHGLEYPSDLERGYDGHEDQFSPGAFRVPLRGESVVVVAATIGEPVPDPLALWLEESARREAEARGAGGDLRAQQALVADAFLYHTAEGRRGVVAGFPWFEEWGRDTYVSLPGLLLARGKVEECGDALEGALAFLVDGLLPNVFRSTPADSHYGSVDASLWFARAVRLYEASGGSRERVRECFFPALTEIATRYRDGTDLGIVRDDAGLIRAGSGELNATWMDARTVEGPVTPRDGCAVEINALWYFLLEYLERLAGDVGDSHRRSLWRAARVRAGAGFVQRFWLPDGRYLADCWRQEDGTDPSVRPNMVIAAALEFSPLTTRMRADVVCRAEAELLTPRGLRTLAPQHPDYRGRYRGDPGARDAAYHQGTVWPWLLGFYCEATLRAFGAMDARSVELRELLEGFAGHVASHGLGFVSEVFDGDPPHQPGGTIAQAWSTAELLRAWSLLEDWSS